MSQPPVLPPIHGQPPQYSPAQMNGAPIQQHQAQPPPLPPPQQNYPNTYTPDYPDTSNAHQAHLPPPPQYHTNGAINGPPQVRYALPPQNMDPRQMQAGRQKKEIKRRTKTGCLTCRKRRIKCDEGHPTCRNCEKSKRECLGYDPIFKSQGAPAPIQPAVGVAPGTGQESTSTYATQGMPTAHSVGPDRHAQSGSPGVQGLVQQAQSINSSPLAGGQPLSNSSVPRTYTTELLPLRRYKHTSIEELFLQENVSETVFPAMDESQPISDQDMIEIKALFRGQYMRALDSFFETTWYGLVGERDLHATSKHARFLKYCVERFKNPPQTPEDLQALSSIEARLVWTLACLPREASSDPQSINPQHRTLLSRISTIEHLLSGSLLPTDQIVPMNAPPLPSPSDHNPEAQATQSPFWHYLSTFTSINDTVSPSDSNTPEIITCEKSLSSMRTILSMLENRDVLYSLAIARHYGGRARDFDPEDLDRVLVSGPGANIVDGEDEIAKLGVAIRFLASEETGGTTQVVQRFVGMGRRGWVKGRRKEVTRVEDVERLGGEEKGLDGALGGDERAENGIAMDGQEGHRVEEGPMKAEPVEALKEKKEDEIMLDDSIAREEDKGANAAPPSNPDPAAGQGTATTEAGDTSMPDMKPEAV